MCGTFMYALRVQRLEQSLAGKIIFACSQVAQRIPFCQFLWVSGGEGQE